MSAIQKPQPAPLLPSPFAVFQPDPAEQRIRRVMEVERELEAKHGMFHAPRRLPNGEYYLAYYAVALDATIQRRAVARTIVEMEERARRYGTNAQYEMKVAELPTCPCGRPLITPSETGLCRRCDVDGVL